MSSMRNWMLGAAMAAGAAGLGAIPAHAAQFGIYVGNGPAAYVPPTPGPGYVWVAGYMSDGYWIPGRWTFAGGGYGYGYGYGDRDRFEHFDRDRGRDWNRGGDRDRGRDFERRDDRGRGWNRDRDRR